MAFSAPLSSKRRPKLTASCLQRQSDELQEEAGVQLPSEDENDDDRSLRLSASPEPIPDSPVTVPELSSAVPKKKRGRPKKVTNEPGTSSVITTRVRQSKRAADSSQESLQESQKPARKSKRLLK